MPRNMRNKQSGFTLVEIAIVLVIIGLLLGGVLKGQELIQSAKVKNVINDFSSTTTAIYGYQDRYKALPGDDNSNGTARWGATWKFGSGNGDGIVNTAGAPCNFYDATTAASLTASTAGTTNECILLWAELRQAGFISGALTGGNPVNAYGGVLGVQEGADALATGAAGTGFKGPIICEAGIPDKAAIALDNQLDDGNPATGSIRAVLQDPAKSAITPAASLAKPEATYLETGTNYYTVCKSM